MWAQVVAGTLGVWLMFAPAVLGHAGTTLAKLDRGLGPSIAAAAFVAVAQITRSVRWLNVALALPLVVAPWFIDVATASRVSTAVSGAVVLVLTPMGRPDQRRYGNGWTSLWRDDDLPGFDAPRGQDGGASGRT